MLLPWWWGLWLATNVLSNLSLQITLRTNGFENAPSQGVLLIDLIAAALNVPLCLILIRLIRRLTSAQVLARQVSAFA